MTITSRMPSAVIYPHRVGTVSSVRSEEVADDEGNKFTVYYFRDGSTGL